MYTTRSLVLITALNAIGLVGVIAVNVLANALPIGGRSTGELSAALPNLFVPSGITFSIWGVIYLLLILFVGYTLIEAVRGRDAAQNVLPRIGPFFFLSCIANVGWIFAWHYLRFSMSLVWMAVLLLSLVAIYVRLEIGLATAGGSSRGSPHPEERLFVHLPFSVYLGWISIATIANVTAVLVAYDWGGFGLPDQTWAALMIAVGTALALVFLIVRSDVFYTLVVIWALIGILIRRTVESEMPAPAVISAALIGLIVLIVGVALRPILARLRV